MRLSEWIEAVERVRNRAVELSKGTDISVEKYERIIYDTNASEGMRIFAAIAFLKEYHLLEYIAGLRQTTEDVDKKSEAPQNAKWVKLSW